MNFYQQRNRWKILLFLFAICIIAFTLWYTHKLAQSIAKEEIKKACEVIVQAITTVGTLPAA